MRLSQLRGTRAAAGTASVLISLAVAGCRPRRGQAPHAVGAPLPLERLAPCAAGVPPDVVGWRPVDDPALTLLLPPAYAEVAVQAMDSHVRRFATADGGRRVGFDYGPWSSSLAEARGLREFAECRARIGGRPARVVTARAEGGRFLAGAAWRDVRPGAHLTVSGLAATRAGRAELLAVLHTVQLKAQ